MSIAESGRIGRRGTFVIPTSLRRRCGLEEGLEIEVYSTERRAELFLADAVDEEDYRAAREAVERMGLDPDGGSP